MRCELIGSPEATAWFCLEFTIVVTPPGARIVVSLDWDGGLILGPDDIGLAHANAAMRWVDRFRRARPIATHLLLREAKRKADSEGTLDESESLPPTVISTPPRVDGGLLVIELVVDGESVVGRLSPEFAWSCDAGPARIWAGARFAAKDFALDNRAALAAQGFEIRPDETGEP